MMTMTSHTIARPACTTKCTIQKLRTTALVCRAQQKQQHPSISQQIAVTTAAAVLAAGARKGGQESFHIDPPFVVQRRFTLPSQQA